MNIARNSRIGGNGLKIGSSGLAVRGAHHAGPVLDAALALFSLVELIRLVKGFDSRVIGLRVEVAGLASRIGFGMAAMVHGVLGWGSGV